MKPLAITVSHFRGWNREHRVSLNAPITSIVAENARGKSSLLNAIEWCLFGAVVTKKGSGIDERQDWEIRTRVNKDDVTPTAVTLELDTAAGPALVTRQRSANAKQREADQLTIREPSGDALNPAGIVLTLFDSDVVASGASVPESNGGGQNGAPRGRNTEGGKLRGCDNTSSVLLVGWRQPVG